MVGQARARNAIAIQSGRVDLRHGSVESLPFDDDSFDKVLAINAMQVWTDPVAGLWEMRRVMRGGRIALGFTPYSGQPDEGLPENSQALASQTSHVVETDKGFCALATKP